MGEGVNGPDAAALTREFGSPLYVYRLERARAAVADLRDAVPGPSHLYYSLKANPHPDLVEALIREGCRAEVSSADELVTALAAGALAEECVYTGPAKTGAELAFAIERGVRQFSVESPADHLRVAAAAASAGAVADCLLRVNGSAAGSTGLRMTGRPSQFGIDFAALAATVEAVGGSPSTRLAGLHFFPVSGARDEDSLLAEIVNSIDLAARAAEAHDLPLRLLDLGGGFAAPYAAPGPRPVYGSLRAGIEAALDERLPGWREGAPQIAFESGRYLVGDCGELVCTVMDVKRSQSGTFVVLDSGINHLGGMAGLGRLLRPAAAPVRTGAEAGTSTIVGPLCTPADVLGTNAALASAEVGDVLTFPNTGAYGLTASLTAFLSRPAPTEVVLRGGTVVSASRLDRRRTPVRSAHLNEETEQP